MKLRPLDDRIVVQRQKAEEKSPGGIIIPDAAKRKTARGEVLAVGPGKLLDSGVRVEPGVAVGQVVVFGEYSGSEVKITEGEILVLREADILGVIES